MEDRPATVGIHVGVGPDADAEEVTVATLQLRRELLDLDVDRQRWSTREQLRLAIITWIERTYHRRRRQ